MIKLAIITSHPIQYNAPLFRMLQERKIIQIRVFYTWSQSESGNKFDPGFGSTVTWDIPLLQGYDYVFSENISADPGSHHFKGIDNPHLIKEISDWQPDALLVYGWSFKSHFKAMRAFHKKIPVFFRGDSTLLNETPGLKRIIRRVFLRFVYSFADVGLYAGEANKEYFAKHRFKKEQLVFMPHATDNARFAPSAENKQEAAEIRKQLAIPPEAFVFLFAGKLDENKNAGLLAEAFLKLTGGNQYLVITGSGAEEKKLKEKYGEQNNIRFTGFQNQHAMPAVYATANVYVMPSKSETWGLGINEAMAAGKPVIVSSGCGAAADLVQEGDNGYMFKNGDEKDLLNCMQKFAANESFSIAAGKRSEEIIKNYSYTADCIALENALTNYKRN